MLPTHRAQPYRATGRPTTPVTRAMKRGKQRYGRHPMDRRRALAKRRPRTLSQILKSRR